MTRSPAPVRGPHPRLIVPPRATQVFRRVVGAWGNEDLIENAFEMEHYSAGDTVAVDGLRVSFHPVPHFVDTFAITISDEAGAKFAFSADTRPGDEVVEAARDADLLLIEATLPRPERTGVRGHLTPEEAGDHARRAGAKRVVLTHISDELGDEWAAEEASRGFGGPVEVARDGAAYEI